MTHVTNFGASFHEAPSVGIRLDAAAEADQP